MNNIRLLVLSVLVMLFVGCLEPTSARGAGWATVDTRLLMVLHPSMATYDFSHGRFYRPGVQNLKSEELQNKLAKVWEQVRPQLKALEAKRSRLLRSRSELLASREETINKMLARGATDTLMVRDHAKNVASFEIRYQSRLHQMEDDLQAVETEYARTSEQAWAPVYLNGVETDRQLAVIRNEIVAFVSDLAVKQGYVLVVDPTAAQDPVMSVGGLGVKVAQSEPVDVLGSELFKLFGQWNVPQGATVPGPDGRPIDLGQHLMPVLFGNMTQNFRQYLEFRPFLPPVSGQLDPRKLTLSGEPDLTESVARGIFQRYQVAAPQQESLLSMIRAFQAREAMSKPAGQVPNGK